MTTSIDQLDLLELPIEDRAFGADPEPWFAQAREKHPWLAKFSHGFLVHGHHEIRDLLAMDDKLHLAVGDVVEIMGATGTPWGDFMQNLVIAKHGDEHKRMRDALKPFFKPRQIAAHVGLIQEVVTKLLDEWAPNGEFDFTEFASNFPVAVMFGLIGATTPMAFVTVSLQDLATPTTAVGKSVSYQFRLAGNPTILGSGTAPIDSQNQIIIPTPSGSGAYELYVSGSHWLRKMVPFNLGTTDVAGLNLSLINGDVVQDNLINTDDYLALSGAFDTVPSDPSWNANADLDENGIINSDDYLILSFNFDTSGD